MTVAKLALLVLISFMFAACATNSYKGEYQDGQYHGQGVYFFADGAKYVGEFARGDFNGQGTLNYANGDIYVGEWESDQRHGHGSYTFSDGDVYVGEWKNGDRHGQGTFSYFDGSSYVGEYRFGGRKGQGTFTAADGKITVGIWADGKIQQETLNPASSMLVNGGSYDGEVVNGEPSGKGVYTHQLTKSMAVKVYSGNWRGDGNASGVIIEVPSNSTRVYYFRAPLLKNYIASGAIKLSMGTRKSSKDSFTEVPYEGVDTFTNAKFSQDIRYTGALDSSWKTELRLKESPGYTGLLDQSGRKQGPGKLVTAEKRVYIGGFKDDLFHGDDTRQYYEGVFWDTANYFNGFKVGYGRVYYDD